MRKAQDRRFDVLIADDGLIDRIAEKITAGIPLSRMASGWGVKYDKLAKWVGDDITRFKRYEDALKVWCDAMCQECVQISDDSGDHKLRIDARFKLASKLYKERYGDAQAQVQVNQLFVTGDPRAQIADLEKRLGIKQVEHAVENA